MDLDRFRRIDAYEWHCAPSGDMRAPVVVFADAALLREMDEKVLEQASNVTMLPGIVTACFVMPDAHWGYGFPIGGVAAFDPDAGGVVSAGGVGFDISCGVRLTLTGLPAEEVRAAREQLADALFATIPAGVGSTGSIHLAPKDMDGMLTGGARWAVQQGYGEAADLERIEEHGCMPGADSDAVPRRAKQRQQDEMGTLGSGNHYLEVQEVAEIFSPEAATGFGLRRGDAVVSIHCGSRGLGHQIGTEFLREMAVSAGRHGIVLPDRELACAPIRSELGERYLGAMRAGINCALANRQIIDHLARQLFGRIFPHSRPSLLFDVSHNTCKSEEHAVDGERRELFVHRKGATRSFGPGHPSLPNGLKEIGQPVLIGGSMGTASYVLVGTGGEAEHAYGSACHGAGRSMSRHAAVKQWRGADLVEELERRGMTVRSPSPRGVAEEAPGAYKDVGAVVDAAEHAGLARKVARLQPMITIKG